MNKKISDDFAEFISKTNAVKFGDFTLKSGAKSNVFFNFGEIYYGNELLKLDEYYADFIVENSLDDVDALFGPAYKGINIVIATSIALFQKHNISIPFAYNRKIQKDHAEGGNFVGCDLNNIGNILIVDDVITDGGTKYEVIDMLKSFENLKIRAFIVGVDREEKDANGDFFRGKFEKETGIRVLSITTKSQVLLYKDRIK